jgi:peptide-methionine (S)-S-oxide reductase
LGTDWARLPVARLLLATGAGIGHCDGSSNEILAPHTPTRSPPMHRWIQALAVALLLAPAAAQAQGEQRATAIFAGGCFWCMEPPFDKLAGVISTTSGSIGGTTANPTYEQVVRGGTGHAEAVQVVYDPTKITYAKLLEVFWRNVDPHDAGGQFCDRGNSYRTGIFVLDEAQKRAAEDSKKALAASGKLKKPIVTEIVPAGKFYPAEGYHQDYYVKNPVRYKVYRQNCGRDERLREVWGAAATN